MGFEDGVMRDEVVLIGPLGAGKTTVAALLGQALGLPVVALDDVRWNYYAEVGYDAAEAAMREARGGFIAKYQYWKPFEIHAVERVLAEHTNCVIEFGAGHSVYEDDAMFERARRALAPFGNVVLLLPCPAPEKSLRILTERGEEKVQLNRHFIAHHSNYDLATHTVYTEGQTPTGTCHEILARLGRA